VPANTLFSHAVSLFFLESAFVMDRKNGDVICSECGTVVSESLMHEGSQFRKFEGEVDRNHHGDAANPLYSNAHNLSTTLGGLQQSGGIAGWGGGGMGGKRNLETILRNAHAYTELNVSQFGKTDRRTRVGYKDKQKKDAFIQMAHVGDALNLHEAVVQRAKELFAGFRDDRELVQQFKGVIGT
jgi:transcription initiation factor TFIIIB Brf1 subunit/transcription initiation factor TFIIB